LKLQEYKVTFICVGLIGLLLLATPTLFLFVKPPAGDTFSELYILGPNHTLSDIPFNVKANNTYLIYLGVGNHLGSSAYYIAYVKLRNETEPLPNVTLGTPSSLLPIYQYNEFVKDGATRESQLSLKITNAIFFNNTCLLQSIVINGVELNVAKTAVWNSANLGYYYDVFIELWLFNSSSGSFQYNQRFVHFDLNVTQS
jgi:hypothetical protein